jgi:hypothetical protein
MLSDTKEARNKTPKSLVAFKDEATLELVGKTDQKTLGVWAIDCAERVLPLFEEEYPQDDRPRKAIEALRTWVQTGIFKMAVIRKASLDAHAAAREVGEDNPARSAARAAGQAVASPFDGFFIPNVSQSTHGVDWIDQSNGKEQHVPEYQNALQLRSARD